MPRVREVVSYHVMRGTREGRLGRWPNTLFANFIRRLALPGSSCTREDRRFVSVLACSSASPHYGDQRVDSIEVNNPMAPGFNCGHAAILALALFTYSWLYTGTKYNLLVGLSTLLYALRI